MTIKNKNLSYLLCFFGIMMLCFVFSGLISNNYEFNDINEEFSDPFNNEDNVNLVEFGEPNNKIKKGAPLGYTIYIDDNWSDTRDYYAWCTGYGNYSDPYIIQDVIIDANGKAGIYIRNSDVDVFRIENCTIYNSGDVSPNDAGIKFWNVCNATIVNNNISYNGGYGFSNFPSSSDTNITITSNNITHNGLNGIYACGKNHTISDNIIYQNVADGMYLNYVSNSTIFNNNITNNDYFGLEMIDCKNNTISNNYLINSTESGINVLSGSESNKIFNNLMELNDIGIIVNGFFSNFVLYNQIFNNTIASNDRYGVAVQSDTQENIFWLNRIYNNHYSQGIDYTSLPNHYFNNTIGNYWGDYVGFDEDDDGIGDTPYKVNDSATHLDNYPLFSDGYNGTQIYIDALATGVNAHNWTWAEQYYWCTGSGSEQDPYKISGLDYNANQSGSGLIINNSRAFFKIDGIKVINSTFHSAGIHLENTTNGILNGNNCSNNLGTGIMLDNVSNINLYNNYANGNQLNGIYAIQSDNLVIFNTNIYGGSSSTLYGINVTNSENIEISNNKLTSGGTFDYGIYLNNVNDSWVKFNNVSNLDIDNEDGGGIIFISSNRNDAYNNTINGGYFGIKFEESLLNDIYNNSIFNSNLTAIHLKSNSDNTTILQNTIFSVAEFAIYIQDSDYCNISFNEIDGDSFDTSKGISLVRNDYARVFNNTIYGPLVGIWQEDVFCCNTFNNTIFSVSTGIFDLMTTYSNISQNIITDTYTAINLADSDSCKVSGHYIDNSNSMSAILIESESINCEIFDNIISLNSFPDEIGIVFGHNLNCRNDVYNNTISGVESGILLDNTGLINIYNNTIYNSKKGIHLEDICNGNLIYENLIYDNVNGIFINGSDFSNITFNNIYNNAHSGIFANNSNDFEIFNNTIYGGSSSTIWGINVTNSINVNVSKNYLYSGGTFDFGILFNNVNDSYIEFNTINNIDTDDGDAGIYLYYSNGNDIYNNTVTSGYNGIFLFKYSTWNEIYNNTVLDSIFYGINVEDNCHYTDVFENVVRSGSRGIAIMGNNFINVFNNTIYNSPLGIILSGSSLSFVFNNTIISSLLGVLDESGTSNNITQNIITYSSSYAIDLSNSDSCKVYDNNIGDTNSGGIRVRDQTINCQIFLNTITMSSSNEGIYFNDNLDNKNDVYNNTITEGNNGISLVNSGLNHIYNNTIVDANIAGINLDNADGNKIMQNIIISPGVVAIYLVKSENCEIYYNDLDGDFSAGVGIGVLSASNWTEVYNNTIYAFIAYGIRVSYSYNNTVLNNTLDGANYGIDDLFGVQNNYTRNTISNAATAGLHLSYSHQCFVKYNRIHDNPDGILMENADNNKIYLNDIYDNTGIGISLPTNSNNNTIIYNDFDGTDTSLNAINIVQGDYNNLSYNTIYDFAESGIYLQTTNVANSTISYNRIYNCGGGASDSGILLYTSIQNKIFNNTVYNNNAIGIQIIDSSNENEIYLNWIYGNFVHGLICTDSTELLIYNNTIFDHSGLFHRGILLDDADFSEAYNNTLRNNYYGIDLNGDQVNVTVAFNNIDMGTGVYGIFVRSSSENCSIYNNTIYNFEGGSLYGINVGGSYNILFNNTIMGGAGTSGIYVNAPYNEITENQIFNCLMGINIETDSAHNQTIMLNKIYDSGTVGIRISQADDNKIYNNTIDGNGNSVDGIYLLTNSNDNDIFFNEIHGCTQNGIKVDDYCENNTIYKNTIYSCNDNGIYLTTRCDNNTISYNNVYGIQNTANINIFNSFNVTICFNTIYEFSNQGTGGILLSSAHSPIIYNNTIYDFDDASDFGVSIQNTNFADAYNNTITNCYYGMNVESSSYATITSNIFDTAIQYGIRLRSPFNDIINNTFIKGYTGIDVASYVNNVTISFNVFYDVGFFAIRVVSNCYNNSIYNNTIDGGIWNTNTGIMIQSVCDQNKIFNNTIYMCGIGIELQTNSDNNSIFLNTIYASSLGGIKLLNGCDNNTIYLNTISDFSYGAGLKVEDSDENKIFNNKFLNVDTGIEMYLAEKNSIHDNFINHSVDVGIYLVNCTLNILTGNLVRYGGNGTVLVNSSFNTLSFETLFNNTEIALVLWGSWNNNIARSTITNNTFGLYIINWTAGSEDSINNNIYWNVIANNTNNGIDLGANNIYYKYWGDIIPAGFAGNYWSNYTGSDGDGDGRGDTAHSIWINSVDPYPLIISDFELLFDSDGDTLSNYQEINGLLNPFGDPTNPNLKDTDGDDVDDNDEINGTLNPFGNAATNPNLNDTDGDGIYDGEEIYGTGNAYNGAPTNPNAVDTDGDGLNDITESTGSGNLYAPGNATNPNALDTDGDGLNDTAECTGSGNLYAPGNATNPNAFDTDGDGLNDTAECTGSGNLYAPGNATNPNAFDTDGDGLNDTAECTGSGNLYDGLPTNATARDTDGDGLSDWDEITGRNNTLYGNQTTNPNTIDTDGDGFTDLEEIQAGVDPNNAFSYPGSNIVDAMPIMYIALFAAVGVAAVIVFLLKTKGGELKKAGKPKPKNKTLPKELLPPKEKKPKVREVPKELEKKKKPEEKPKVEKKPAKTPPKKPTVKKLPTKPVVKKLPEKKDAEK